MLALFFAGIIEAASVFFDAPESLVYASGVAVASITFLIFHRQDNKKAAVLNSIAVDCYYITLEIKCLWDRIDDYDSSDDEVLASNRELLRRLIASASRSMDLGVYEDRELNEKCWDEACTVLEAEYAI